MIDTDNDFALFVPEEYDPASDRKPASWKILLVDDEPDVHSSLKFALRLVAVENRELELIDAYSAAEAKTVLEQHPDVALILLDVVMEHAHAGLDLVRHVRKDLDNHTIQIILITGQPGYASQRDVVQNYKIDGYRIKSELTSDKIFFSVYSALRTYKALSELASANRRLSETQYAIECAGIAIVRTEVDNGLILYANERACRQLGYNNEELLQRSIFDIVPEFSSTTYRTVVDQVRQHSSLQLEATCRRKNDELYAAEISLYFRASPQRNRIIALMTDISARKATEFATIQAKNAAEAVNRAKDAFLANVSHELRTPLNAVIGLSDLALRISREPALTDYLHKIATAGKSLADIVDDLLDISKIAADRMELRNVTFSLRALLARIISIMTCKAEEKNLQLIERIDADVPDILQGDPLRIEQIVLNLLGNAIKFTHRGRVQLQVGLHGKEDDKIGLSIAIEDTGIGMHQDDIARLFQPFTQADVSMSRNYGGTGLGLAICRRLVDMMQGEIQVVSHSNQGTTFHVLLWLAPGEAKNLSHPPACAENLDSLPAHYENTRVLIVDDQAINREIVGELLASVGIHTEMAQNGQEALDILQSSAENAFDLVLMDIQMPRLDGLEACRRLRRQDRFKKLPIVAMTAHTMEHEKQLGFAVGMDDHIGKPFDTQSFFRTIAQWIDRAKQRATAPYALPPRVASDMEIAGIDYPTGLNRFLGNKDRYHHWLDRFIAEGPASLHKIRQFIASGQNELARKTAHALKGHVGMLGMIELHPIVSSLEAALKHGENHEEFLEQSERLAADLSREIGEKLKISSATST